MRSHDASTLKSEATAPDSSRSVGGREAGHLHSSPSNQALQRKVRIGSTSDPLEAEADRAANAVLSGDTATIGQSVPAAPVQRKCTQCAEEETGTAQGTDTDEEEMTSVQRQPLEEEEEMMQPKAAEGGLNLGTETLQRQPMEEEEELLQPKKKGGSCPACATNSAPAAGETAASAVANGGRPLSSEDRSYFEPRFGRDFSDVRLHTHSTAERAAGDINARAYTLGQNIAFGPGQYSPNTESGRHLMAHELAHVVQQKGRGQPTVRRAVSSKSKCAANKHSAPAKPLERLEKINQQGEIMSMMAGLTLSLITLEPSLFKPEQTAFKERFGEPPADGKKFKNRWNGKKHDTKDKAFLDEINSAAGQFDKVTNTLGNSIRYHCPGKKGLALPGCKKTKCKSSAAFVCPGFSLRHVAVCPNFWGFSNEQLGGALIHEAVHARLNRKGHPQDVDKRHKNPECYTSFVADTNGFTPFDPKCPKIP